MLEMTASGLCASETVRNSHCCLREISLAKKEWSHYLGVFHGHRNREMKVKRWQRASSSTSLLTGWFRAVIIAYEEELPGAVYIGLTRYRVSLYVPTPTLPS